MKTSQWILIACGIGITLGLYFFGPIKSSKPLGEGTETMGGRGPMQGANPFTGKGKSNINLADSLDIFRQMLNETQRDSLKLLEEKLTKAGDNKLPVLLELAGTWRNWRSPELASYYQLAAAAEKNDLETWQLGADEAFIAMKMSPDTLWKNYFADKAIEGYEKTITFAPSNLDLQVSLAECYVEGKEAIMKGVKMLQDVTAKDSTHIGANLLLGKLAITSGQYDKALVRLEKLVAFAPENSEALYYLGETYLALGEKEKAVDVFEKCKKLVKNPAFSKELDEYIKNNIGK